MPAVLCSKCATDLPDGSQFCLKCGEPVKTTPPASEYVVTAAALGCSGCGAKLQEGAQFCSRCGKSVSVPKKTAPAESAQSNHAASPENAARMQNLSRRLKRRLIPLVTVGVVVLAIFWAATSDNPYAQNVQEFAGWKHDQGIVDNPFSISPHNLRYYKFVLPQGSMRVSIVGEFSVASDPQLSSSKGVAGQADNNIEVYVMSEAAFVAWQNGYATTNVYESGRVSRASVQAELPDGAGVYYLIFNNKFAPSAAKRVNADVLLRYKNWLPESFRRISERFWNWLGI